MIIRSQNPDIELPLSPQTLQLLEGTVDGLWLIDSNDHICYYYTAIDYTYEGLSLSLQDRPVYELIIFSSEFQCVKDCLQAIKNREAYQCNNFMIRYQQRIPHVVRFSGHPLYDEQQNYLGFLGTIVDLGRAGVIQFIRDEVLRQLGQIQGQPLGQLNALVAVVREKLLLDAIFVCAVDGNELEVLACSQAMGPEIDVNNFAIADTPFATVLTEGRCLIDTKLLGIDAQLAHHLGNEYCFDSFIGYRLEDVEGNTIGVIAALHRHSLQPVDIYADVFTSLCVFVAPRLNYYLSTERANEQNQALTQAYRLAKVGSWVKYAGVKGKLKWSSETYSVWGVNDDYVPNLKKLFRQVHPDDRQQVGHYWNQLKKLGGYTQKYRIFDHQGKLRWILESAEVEYDSEGRYVRAVGVMQDITEQERDEEKLRTLAYAVFESSNIVYSLDNRARIVECNPAFEACTGYSREEVIGQPVSVIFPHDAAPALFWQLARELLVGHEWRGETEHRRRNGEIFSAKTLITPVCNSSGEIISYLCVQEDITEKKERDAQLHFQAYHDALTGLPNRHQVHTEVNVRLSRNEIFSLLFIDLDGFKYVNDSLGHMTGDDLLKRVGKRLQASIRDRDMLARLGGDEFLVVLESNSDAQITAERILKTLSYKFVINGRIMHLGGSIGIVHAPQDGESAEVLIRNADAAMYHAKANGKNTYSIFSGDIYHHTARRLQLETGLRHALKLGELSLYFQPQQSLVDGSLLGAEALCRWHSLELGVVSPVEFIPLAEELGLIDEIGDWVVAEALRNCRLWRDRGASGAVVSINVSPRQFRTDGLLATIASGLERYHLPPSALFVEVTETLLMDNYEQALTLLALIRDMGVSLAIDDFGVGYSSLSYLKRFPFDSLKIDRSFVGEMELVADDFTLVKTIIQLAHNLSLKVVAEGVENINQQQLLTEVGCDAVQGYFISYPLPAKDFVDYILNNVEDIVIDVN